VSVLIFLGVLGCRESSKIAPERSPRGSASAAPVASTLAPAKPERTKEPSRRPKPALAAPVGGRYALAIPNAANGVIEIVIADRPTACGPHRDFPSNCEPAWRVRIDLPPEQQKPGEYLLGDELTPFSYRDAQGKSGGGVWGEGVDCANLGGHFDGVLEIVAIDSFGITGNLTGAGAADGPFRAERCPSCKGTGMACTANAECCMNHCGEGGCSP
jgi:hypothetical protein